MSFFGGNNFFIIILIVLYVFMIFENRIKRPK